MHYDEPLGRRAGVADAAEAECRTPPQEDLMSPSNGHPLTVRMPESLTRDLKGLTILDKTTLADELRRAATEYVERRKADPELPEKVARAKDERMETLSDLANLPT
jgi:hypothetical protein